MTNPAPVSPSNETPVLPVSRIAAPTHETSPVFARRTLLKDTSVPAINAQPVELDGMPTSPQEQELKRRVIKPAEDEDIDAEFLSEGGKRAGQLGRENRMAMLATRSKDPSVIVDVPSEPTAEEVEAVDSTGRKSLEIKT